MSNNPLRSGAESSEVAPEPLNPLFRLALIPVGLLIVTVLGLTATQFGNADAPLPRWLNGNAGWLISLEVGASVLLALLAIAADRRAIIAKSQSSGAVANAGDSSESDVATGQTPD